MSQDNRKIRFGLWYDFRNLSQWHQSPDQLYAATLDQIGWGDNHGFDDVWLSEHHIEDGYLPSILPVAAAVAARTKRIRIASGVLLMPFHNPVRLAEDIASARCYRPQAEEPDAADCRTRAVRRELVHRRRNRHRA